MYYQTNPDYLTTAVYPTKKTILKRIKQLEFDIRESSANIELIKVDLEKKENNLLSFKKDLEQLNNTLKDILLQEHKEGDKK